MSKDRTENTDSPAPIMTTGPPIWCAASERELLYAGYFGANVNPGASAAEKTASVQRNAQRLSPHFEMSEMWAGFDNNRLVSEGLPSEGREEWYFRAREGIMGPYPSRAVAKAMLMQFLARCQKQAYTGGR